MAPSRREVIAAGGLKQTQRAWKAGGHHKGVSVGARRGVDPRPPAAIVRARALLGNWLARLAQNPVVGTSCWFESGQGHQPALLRSFGWLRQRRGAGCRSKLRRRRA